MTFFTRLRPNGPPAWTVLASGSAHLRFVRGSAETAGRPRVLDYGEAALGGEKQDLNRAAKQLHIPRTGQLALLLNELDYRIHMVDAPNVPPNELKAAMKWRLKEIIDFPVEEASYDVLDLPVDRHGSEQSRSVYAIAARKPVLRGYVERLDKAHLPVSVIDIQETAQRNIAALFEEENRAVGVLYLGEAAGLLTVSAGGELYLARRLDASLEQLRKVSGEARTDVFYRVVLELQRTLDNFERQFSSVAMGKLLLAPQPEETGLLEYLVANLGMRVEAMDLQSVLDMPREHELDLQAQWRYFHLIGCSLRSRPDAP